MFHHDAVELLLIGQIIGVHRRPLAAIQLAVVRRGTVLPILAEVSLLGHDLALMITICDVVGNVVELARGGLEDCADRLVLLDFAYVTAFLVQGGVIAANNVLLIHDDILLVGSWRSPEASLLRFFGNDPVLVHVGGAAQVHETTTEGADVVDVRMVKGGTVFAGAWVVIAVELGWLHLPKLRLLDLDVMIELQWSVFFEHG